MRNAAISLVELAVMNYTAATGLLTDELESNAVGASPGVLLGSSLSPAGSIDERILPELSTGSGTNADAVYGSLQQARGSISQALGALLKYDTAAPPALRGEMYALQGYVEILLADFYCSGVPLSTLDFEQDFTYHASSTKSDVYHDALTKLDSALALAGDSASVLNLARVVRGRAWLALGQYDSAMAAVDSVPETFQYQITLPVNPGCPSDAACGMFSGDSVSDHEGGNGLPYLSSNDPRTTATSVPVVNNFGHFFILFPAKYQVALNGTGTAPFIVADGIEAQLIRAEVALHRNDPATMITILNHLRTTAMAQGQTQPVSGTLVDPGSSPRDSARIALLFQERGYWLYLTGHRQGDLRRLIANYGFPEEQLYPIGVYTAPGAGFYGNAVNAPIPSSQYENPLYHGCLNRAA